jgi:co-chaperonin GroES (HSP10)
MNVKLFGHRCLVEFYRPKTASKIIIPDSAQNTDTHRLGIVRFVGDGVLKGKATPEPALVKPGDVVMFQINGMMEATQKFVLDGKHYMNLLQGDLIARINGEDLTAENMEMLGDYVLLKHFVRQQPGSTLFLPDNAVRQSAPDFIYFRCVKKSTTVDLAVEIGNEVVVNFGRLTPMFIVKRNDDGTTENQEFCYTRKEWVDGVVEEAPDGDTQQV